MNSNAAKSEEVVSVEIESMDRALNLISLINDKASECEVIVTDGKNKVDGHSLLGVLSLISERNLSIYLKGLRKDTKIAKEVLSEF